MVYIPIWLIWLLGVFFVLYFITTIPTTMTMFILLFKHIYNRLKP